MVVINTRLGQFKERPWSLPIFVLKLVGKCNQVIYEEAIAELCCPAAKEGGDDNSVIRTVSTESEKVMDDTEKWDVMSDMTDMFGHAKEAVRPTIDDSPGELTNKARRSRSTRKSRSFRKSRSMGGVKDKELTRGSSPMRRSRTSIPRRTRSPRRAVSPQRQSASTPRNSRTPKREGAGKKKLQDASPATRNREEPPVASKATRAFSTLRRSSGSKPSKNNSKEIKDNNKQPTPAVLEEPHPMTRKQSRRHKSRKSSSPNGKKVVLEANPPIEENIKTAARHRNDDAHNLYQRSAPVLHVREFITPPALLAASRNHYEHTNHPSRESPCGSPDHHIEASIVSYDARDPGNCRRDDHRYDGGGCPRPYYDDVPRFSPNNIPRSSCDDAGRRSYYAPPQAQNYQDDSQRYSHHEFRHEDQRRFQQQNYQDESRRFHDRSHYQSYDPRYQHSTHRQHAPPQYDQRFLIAYPVA